MGAEEEEELREEMVETQKRWAEACELASAHVKALCTCGLEGGTADSASLPRLNALAQDCLASLRSLQRRFDLLAHQSISVEEKDACMKLLEGWKTQYQNLHAALRSANLQAKANIQKAAKSERDLLLGGGEESTNLRRNLQTQAGMSAAAESVTESLRRTRQMMVQELERGFSTLTTLDESNTTLRKADSEYKGQRSLLNAARGLLSVLKRQDILDRIILVVGFIVFSAVVTFIFNQRIGLFKMQRAPLQPYGDHESQMITSSVSIDILPEGGTEMLLHHSPSIGENKGLAFSREEPGACMSLGTGTCPNTDPPSSVPASHTEL